MRLLILSDTHGYLPPALTVLEQMSHRIDGVLHLGDLTEDIESLRAAYPQLPFVAVRGNNDFDTTPRERLLTTGGYRIAMTHGHRFGVYRGLDSLYYWSLEQEADLVLFGHTHTPLLLQEGNCWFFNPGSLSLPRSSAGATFGLVTVEEGSPLMLELWSLNSENKCKLMQKNS